MSVEALMTVQATLTERVEAVLPDGDVDVTGLSTRAVMCHVERVSQLELRDNQLVSITYWQVFLPLGEEAFAGDMLTVDLLGAHELELESDATPVWNARLASPSHREARARQVS